MRRRIRDSMVYAFVQGIRERWHWRDGYGRTHLDDAQWNDWYDRGANVADALHCIRTLGASTSRD